MPRDVVLFEDFLLYLRDAYRAGVEATGVAVFDAQLERVAEEWAMKFVDEHPAVIIPIEMLQLNSGAKT